jgi:pyridoxal biosynthesis lyase PdxS
MRICGFLIASMVVAAACGMARPADAAIIFQDSFDYAVGSAVNGSNGGTGWAGAWTVGAAVDYSFTPQDIAAPTSSFATGNQLRLDPLSGTVTPSISRNINIDTTGEKRTT